MLKYNRIILLDSGDIGDTLERLKKDEILLGKINNKTAMVKLLDDEEIEELRKQIDIK